MKYLFSFILMAATLTPFMAKADIAPSPGFHALSLVSVIDNLEDYPDYDVYVSYGWRFGPTPELAKGPESISSLLSKYDGHSSLGAPWLAVKQSDQARIVHKDDPNGEQGDQWYSLSQNQKYLVTAKVSGKPSDFSDELTGEGGYMPDSNPVYGYEYTYHIDSLNDGTFTVHLANEAQYDKTGKLLSQTQVTSSEQSKRFEFDDQTAMLTVIIALGVMVIILGVKAWRK